MAADGIPAGLAETLARRGAEVERSWNEAARSYLYASAPGGRLFARSSADPADRVVLEHEAAARAIVGTAGPLRAPPVLERGPGWLLEAAIEPESFGGEAHVQLVAAAAARLRELDLPEQAIAPARGGSLRRRLRILASPLPLRDVRRARAIIGQTDLPLVTAHGDFHPGNVLLSRGAAWVVDWELSGRRPAGFDLLHFWATVGSGEDRDGLFAAAVQLVGPDKRRELVRLRYALLVRAIAAKLSAGMPFDRDPEGARRLLALLPDVRREAGLR